LKQFIQEFKDGKRETSAVSVQTIESINMDDKESWRTIRKELKEIGITIAAFDANKDVIMGWFKEAIESGAFEEQMTENKLDYRNSESDERLSLRYLDADMEEIDTKPLIPTLETLATSQTRSPESLALASSTLNEPGLKSTYGNALPGDRMQPSPSIEETRYLSKPNRSRLSSLVARVLSHDNALLEACKGGDVAKSGSPNS
jgi:hypothetical protein